MAMDSEAYARMPEAHLLVLVALFTMRDCPKHMLRAAISELPGKMPIPSDPAEIIDQVDIAIARATTRQIGPYTPWE